MNATLSSKGQLVLPLATRRRLGLLPGTKFRCRITGDEIVLTPQRSLRGKTRLVRDRLTGMRVTEAPKGAPVVTSDQVRALLVDFP